MSRRARLPSGVKQILLWSAPLAWLGCAGSGGTDIVLPSLSVTTATTGVDLDPDGYNVVVDGNAPRSIGLDGSISVDQLSDGPHTVALSGVAANCVAGDNPRSVTVSTGVTTPASFTITCGAATGSIVATTTTTGEGSDPDGFALTLDGADLSLIGMNATLNLTGVTPAAHLLGLTGIAANCQVTGDNPRSVTVAPGQSITVPFEIRCTAPAPNPGTIQVSTTTTGSNPDPDGYSVSVDGGAAQPIASNATLAIPNISAGSHGVQLLGAASNCTVVGSNPAQVNVVAGSTAGVGFTVTCVPPPPDAGSVQIDAATSGVSQDDSYTVTVDGGSPQPLSANGSDTLSSLTPGVHSLRLSGIAPNCTVSGANPRPVSITAGQMATVTFAITCVTPPPNTGSVQITAATTGSSPDADGYTVTIDGGNGQPLASNASLIVPSLTPGSHSAQLAGVAANCAVAGNNPRSFAIDAGKTKNVSFAISCVSTAPSLNLRISTLYLTQSTQTLAGTVPLVAGKAGYLRVFVVTDRSTGPRPSVEVTLQNGSTITKRTINPPIGATPTGVHEAALDSSWNLPIEASLVQPGLTILAQVDPQNTIAETNESDNTFPASGTPQSLTVNPAPEAKIRFVPIQQGDAPPGNVTDANKDQLVETTHRLYPLNAISTDLHPVYQVAAGQLQANGTGWNQVLTDLDGIRVAEGSDRTYFGVANLGYQFGVVGLGFVGLPTAMGTDAASDVKRVIAHELGHTWNQLHTPCANPPNTDPNYPYGTGIGVYGFDVAATSLKPPTTPDIMGYCENPWISDYIYRRVMNYRSAASIVAAQAAASPKQPALLVWGRIVHGQPVLEPAFHIVTRPHLPEAPGPYSIEGIADDGTSLFALSFQAAEIADDPSGSRHFAFAVPLDQARAARLGSLRVSGPGGAAAATSLSAARISQRAAPDSIVVRRQLGGVDLEWNPSAHRMIMVRDPDTGDVLAFARGGKTRVRTTKGRLDLVASDGVQSETMRAVPR
jgi:hypothetical protein